MNYTVKIVIPVQTGIVETFYQFDNQESAMIFANTALMSSVDRNIKVSILINKNIKEEN